MAVKLREDIDALKEIISVEKNENGEITKMYLFGKEVTVDDSTGAVSLDISDSEG